MFHLAPAELFIIMSIVFLIFGILLIPKIFYCLTLQKCLTRCSPQCRTLVPGQVWLLLIPLFDLVWHFIVVTRVSSSLANEFRFRNMAREPEPGKSLGLAYCILYVCGIVPFLGIFSGIAGFVCWILYWVKIAGYSAEIAMPAVSAPAADPRIVL